VLFAGDTSALFANNFNYLQTLSVSALIQVDEWFTVNGLSYNINTTNVMHK